jgi:hypothetical protein
MNLKVLDPIIGELKWKKQRVGVLGAKSRMTKHQAQDSGIFAGIWYGFGTVGPQAMAGCGRPDSSMIFAG